MGKFFLSYVKEVERGNVHQLVSRPGQRGRTQRQTRRSAKKTSAGYGIRQTASTGERHFKIFLRAESLKR